jgi:hypothetical protein
MKTIAARARVGWGTAGDNQREGLVECMRDENYPYPSRTQTEGAPPYRRRDLRWGKGWAYGAQGDGEREMRLQRVAEDEGAVQQGVGGDEPLAQLRQSQVDGHAHHPWKEAYSLQQHVALTAVPLAHLSDTQPAPQPPSTCRVLYA